MSCLAKLHESDLINIGLNILSQNCEKANVHFGETGLSEVTIRDATFGEFLQ